MVKRPKVISANTMSTGIQLEDEDKMQWEHEDWVGHKLDLPMPYEPGAVYEYSSGGSNLLTGVIQKSVGTYLPLFFHALLFKGLFKTVLIDNFKMRLVQFIHVDLYPFISF
jgi:CubicO group peptidase (beta-lactamase class C family)